jgi:hypothetical protein
LRHLPLRRSSLGVLLLAGPLLLAAGCGGAGDRDLPPAPSRVPPGSVAVVGTTSVAKSSFDHWLAIVSEGHADTRTSARRRRQAAQRTVTFLIKAQWLLQEAAAEGINGAALNELVSHQAANTQQSRPSGLSRSDAAFQARLDAVAELLESRHGAVSIGAAQITRYYAAHRSQFAKAAVRDTLMVVTHDRASALRAKAALATGQGWAPVAKRWSIDSSALNGAAYAVMEGAQSPSLVRAVFAARPGRITGPVRATPVAQPTVSEYYVFKVTGEQPASAEPLTQVTPQIRQTLTEQRRQRALGAFTRAYDLRWRNRTLCAAGYLVAECRNDRVTRRVSGRRARAKASA